MQDNLFVATISKNYMDQAFKELLDLDQGLKLVKQYETGIMVFRPAMEKKKFNNALIEKKSVFIRHVNSIDYSIDVSGGIDIEAILEVTRSFEDQINEGESVGVQVRKAKGDYELNSTEIKETVDKVLIEEMKAIPQTKEPDKVISILFAESICYIGLSKAIENISSWSGGMIHYKKEFNDVSRSRYKLMEAMYVFGINLDEIRSDLDLGAAPGGWASVLLEHGIKVTAVDTREMEKRLADNPNFVYIKKDLEALELEPDTLFDMITFDMSMNPYKAAGIIISSAKYLKNDGIAVITVKLATDKIWKSLKEVMKKYGEVFEILGAKQLFHNRDEITLYMKKRS